MVLLIKTAQILPNRPIPNILSLCISYNLYGFFPPDCLLAAHKTPFSSEEEKKEISVQ